MNTYLDVPLAPLQQGYCVFDFLVCDRCELLKGQLLVFGKLSDIEVRVRHAGGL